MNQEDFKDLIKFDTDSRRNFGRPNEYLETLMNFGTYWTGKPLPRAVRKMPNKECYKNSTIMTFDRSGYRYVEGVAARRNMPILIDHAWCIDTMGRIVDTTWEKPSDEDQYLGLIVPPAILRRELLKNRYYGVFNNQVVYNLAVLREVVSLSEKSKPQAQTAVG